MGLFLNIGAKFIESIFGFDKSDQMLNTIMIVLLILVLLYTMMGGMLSVVVTDYFQFIVLSRCLAQRFKELCFVRLRHLPHASARLRATFLV